MKRRVIWGTLLVVVVAAVLVGGRALSIATNKPNVVSSLTSKVVPNHVFQTYQYPYQLTVKNRDAALYSAPAGTFGARKLGTVRSLNVPTAITAKTRKDLNGQRADGYANFDHNGKSYWISVQDTQYRNLNALKGNNPKVEAAIAAGMALVGKAKYVYGGGRNMTDIQNKRYDCSSFVRHCYAQAGVNIGPLSGTTTFTLLNVGKPVAYKDMKRGDLLFFTIKRPNDHVGMYLGNNLFLEAVTSTDTHGVGISTLYQKNWRAHVNGTVRRMIS